ncbi:hypothetical protein HMPREF9022_00386 [Erysipelotrichaceae bacterium 2_2_44A]|uniref:Uncharacterized protein n=2 Tax=Clostridium innocuum TaxID=1522 RepID=N9WSI4_CLOIN|nr:hypothetical protein HMPREF9022_00386 [Erysipelotrichaceae bacterium 2_2_44A]ENY86543.1 hypothetical protein HMPREF1094_02338 [[Clostridium] innocuum 2959]PWJ13650.1 hypothetical protein ATF84_11110 [[Clostridium] innocuum]SSA46182.1 hypothetical protein SAMN04487929_11110 [[Clostridium] innocuum]
MMNLNTIKTRKLSLCYREKACFSISLSIIRKNTYNSPMMNDFPTTWIL